jgi:hypothetical protein
VKKQKDKCCRCGDKATIFAADYPGPPRPYCDPCRRQVRSGADSWPWTGIAWGAGPKNGRSERKAIA